MTGFNVKKYNDEINRLETLMDNAAQIIWIFSEWGVKKEASKGWFERLLADPKFDIQEYLDPENMIKALQEFFHVASQKDCNNPSFLSRYANFLEELDEILKIEMDFLELLPEMREAYGKLFTVESWFVVNTDDAERLIMEQCIEWEED